MDVPRGDIPWHESIMIPLSDEEKERADALLALYIGEDDDYGMVAAFSNYV